MPQYCGLNHAHIEVTEKLNHSGGSCSQPASIITSHLGAQTLNVMMLLHLCFCLFIFCYNMSGLLTCNLILWNEMPNPVPSMSANCILDSYFRG